MSKILDFITTLAGEVVSIIAIAGKILAIAQDLLGRVGSIFGWKWAINLVDWTEKHNLEGWLERIAKYLKKFKSSQG